MIARNVTTRQIRTDLFFAMVNGEFSFVLFSPGMDGKIIFPNMAMISITIDNTANSTLHLIFVPMDVIIGKPIPSPKVPPDIATAIALPCMFAGTIFIA